MTTTSTPAPTDLEERYAAIEASHAAWVSRLKSQRLPARLADLSVEKYADHPIRELILAEADPTDFTYQELGALHSIWYRTSPVGKRRQARKKTEKKRSAIWHRSYQRWRKDFGEDHETARIMADHEFAETDARFKAEGRRRRSLERRKALLTDVLMHWKALGAKLQGVRFPLSDNSKAVKWAAERFSDRDHDQGNLALRRMAAKKRGWKTDYEDFRVWKPANQKAGWEK